MSLNYVSGSPLSSVRTCAAAMLAFVVLTTMIACGRTSEPPATGTPAGEAPVFLPEATIKDLMLGLVDTSADVVWLSVTTTVSDKGMVDVRPKNDEEWAEVRYGALRLVEAANLLMIPGRRVAPPGDKSVAPGVELEPEEMDVMIAKDRAGWNQRSKALHDAAMLAVRAAEAKDADKIFEVGETIEHACEGCHRQYWYPNEVIPELPAAPDAPR
jgi:hypothetical protein